MTARILGFCILVALSISNNCAVAAQHDTWDAPSIKARPNHDDVASNPSMLPQLIKDGQQIFNAKFNELDGAGRPAATGDSKPTPRNISNAIDFIRTAGPDAMSCASCHNQPTIGGSGDFVANVFVGAHFSDPPTHRIDLEITNERNTLSIFGDGLIEILAKEISEDLHAIREKAVAQAKTSHMDVRIPLTTKGVQYGTIVARPDGTIDMSELEGIDYDLVIRPFGVKGVACSLREFSIAALNQHHGIQAIERFGWERTGLTDFDMDGVSNELSIGQLSALVLFQAQLPPPKQIFSTNVKQRQMELLGEKVFQKTGCDYCHVPAIPVKELIFHEPNPFNRPGAIAPDDVKASITLDVSKLTGNSHFIKAYTDLKRHNLCDPEHRHFCNEINRQDNVPVEMFLTAKLWDVGSSAPYGHRGDLRTISEIILNHGGEAGNQREKFMRLSDHEKRALIAFLQSLGREKQ